MLTFFLSYFNNYFVDGLSPSGAPPQVIGPNLCISGLARFFVL